MLMILRVKYFLILMFEIEVDLFQRALKVAAFVIIFVTIVPWFLFPNQGEQRIQMYSIKLGEWSEVCASHAS